jgi:hypothetical protein
MPAALNRRDFLARTTALASLSTALLADPLRSQNLGVQLYTVRTLLPKDPMGILKQIKDIGYAEIRGLSLCGPQAARRR